MKASNYKPLIYLAAILMGSLLFSCTQQKERAIKPHSPNILLIISDDQAWSDYSFMGHEHIETPNIDQLAASSLTFTRGYVSAPLCSPSLATIITGLYPHQHGITGNDPRFTFDGKKYQKPWMVERQSIYRPAIQRFNQLPLLTKRLAKLNYRSLQTGKWWMGSWLDGHFSQGMTHGDPTRKGRHGDAGLTIGREGLQNIYDFIDSTSAHEQPFFVWYAPFLPHSPHTPPADLEAKYIDQAPTPAIAKYWAMCEWFDQTCGNLLQFLEDRQLTEETLVIYVCDNGWIQKPDQVNRYAPRSKQSPYEGGIRTPLLFKWPGKIMPQLDTQTLVSSIDIVPTILGACGLPVDPQLPGINVLDDQTLQNRTTIFAEDFDHDIHDLNEPSRSLQHRIAIHGPWKYILPDTTNVPDAHPELYHLLNDPSEQQNQINQFPNEAQKLQKAINVWWQPAHLTAAGVISQ